MKSSAAAPAVAAIATLLGIVGPAQAWNDTGHQIIALVAWDGLSVGARRSIVDLLRRAPGDAGLAQMLAGDGRPLVVREREFVRRASTWPDLVRSPEPAARHTYDRPPWHFRNFFWRQGASGSVDLPDRPGHDADVVERLEHLRTLLADPTSPAGERAVGLAWVLHLVGDIHQPFHCSSRVTSREPDGDQGGNLFRLGSSTDNLHRYWDTMLDRAVPRRPDESTGRYLTRAAALVLARPPAPARADELRPGKFEDWARESLAEAKAAYPPTLRRGRDPGPSYARWAARVALERAARAGYRLAALLEELYGDTE